MQTKTVATSLAAIVIVCLAAATGCAKKDVDALRNDLNAVSETANAAKTSGDEAKRMAAMANETANEAKTMAADAKATADEGVACCQTTNEKLDRMFEKSMRK